MARPSPSLVLSTYDEITGLGFVDMDREKSRGESRESVFDRAKRRDFLGVQSGGVRELNNSR